MELLSKLLREMNALDASDLFLSTGSVPVFRVHGQLQAFQCPPLSAGSTDKMAQLILKKDQIENFEHDPEVNVGVTIPNVGRFRFNIFRQRNDIAMVIRSVPAQVPNIAELGLPDIVQDIVTLKHGLVLVVGPSGAGKSTTLAAMLDYRNRTDISHIITIEDPIEYVINHKRSVVNQREVGIDTNSCKRALNNALRQSPDVIMVGETLNADMMEPVLEFAETGHLCLTSLHANNASQAFERIVHMFAKHQRDQVTQSLGRNVKAVISQTLVPTINGGRIAAVEVLTTTPRVTDLISRGKFDELAEVLEKDTQSGMQTLDQSLFQLLKRGKITPETAISYAHSASNMRLQIRLAQNAKAKKTQKSLPQHQKNHSTSVKPTSSVN